MQIATLNFTTPLTILATDGIQRMSLKARGGPVNLTGGFTFRTFASQPIILDDGDAVTLESTPNSPIEGLVIDPTGASVEIMFFYN